MGREIKPDSNNIPRILTMIEEGEIKIPPLQRPFVWKVSKIIDLLESVYKDYPIGSILLWESLERLPSVRSIAGFKAPNKNPELPIYYVLDGQQRFSSLYGVFAQKRTVDKSEKGYEIDINKFNIWFDLTNKKFIHADDKIQGRKYLELKNLLDAVNLLEMIEKYPNKEKRIAQDLHKIFTSYEIPLIITKKRSREEVGIIFERINSRGAKLDLFDLMVAWTWTSNFHLKEKFDEVYRIIEKKDFTKVKPKILLQCVSVIITESSKTKIIVALKPDQIRQYFEVFIESLKRTIDYLHTEFRIKTDMLLPHSHQLVPLCYFFSKVTTPSIEQRKAINQWFWKSSFSKHYASGTDESIDEDVAEFKKIIKNKKAKVFTKLTHDVTTEQLRNTKFLRSNAYSRAFILLLANKLPKSLLNGGVVDTGEALSGFNKREYHHVFPKNFLEKRGVGKEAINSLCNFCILPSYPNKKILNQAPSKYFKNLIPEKGKKEILESNLLPVAQSIYQKDDYAQFLKMRSGIIIEYLESVLL